MRFSRFSTFIFDLDGTVWNWKSLFPGVNRVIRLLKIEGKQVLFVTNNTIVCRNDLVRKLENFGIEVGKNDLVSPALVITEYLKKRGGSAMVFSDGLKKDIMKSGIKVSNDSHADHLVVGHDTNFNFQKLCLAVEALKNGASFLAAARGRFFVNGNDFLPGTGVIVKTLEYATGRKATLLGKPSNLMCQTLHLFVQSPRNRTVIFGDELNSDIVMGSRCGYFTVLVRTGVDKILRGKVKPNAVLDSLADLKL
jgi:HAD superfamily hydrolase (TIGR01450 family)